MGHEARSQINRDSLLSRGAAAGVSGYLLASPANHDLEV
jgi:hypothetical protein